MCFCQFYANSLAQHIMSIKRTFQKKPLFFMGCIIVCCVLLFVSLISKNQSLPILPPKNSEKVTLCSAKLKTDDSRTNNIENSDIPFIYFITPTYQRAEQISELTRLGQTLLHVKNLHWVLADDSKHCSEEVNSLLGRLGIPYTHVSSPIPDLYKDLPMGNRPRGVSGRRAGIQWVLNHHKKLLGQINDQNDPKSLINTKTHSSVIYFGDDDNT